MYVLFLCFSVAVGVGVGQSSGDDGGVHCRRARHAQALQQQRRRRVDGEPAVSIASC